MLKPTRTVPKSSSDGNLGRVYGLFLTTDGTLYASSRDTRNVHRLTDGGTWTVVTDSGGNNGDFTWPTGIFVTDDGTLYASDRRNGAADRIRRLVPGGVWETVTDTSGNDGDFTNPWDLLLTDDGTLYVADASLSVVKRLPAGGDWEVVTDINGSDGNLAPPVGIDIASDGTLYVATNNGVLALVPGGAWLDFLPNVDAEWLTVEGSVLYVSIVGIGIQGIAIEEDGGACNNSVGGSCFDNFECQSGLICNTDSLCEDIDECALSTDDCGDGERCNNTVGSFVCSCINRVHSPINPFQQWAYVTDESDVRAASGNTDDNITVVRSGDEGTLYIGTRPNSAGNGTLRRWEPGSPEAEVISGGFNSIDNGRTLTALFKDVVEGVDGTVYAAMTWVVKQPNTVEVLPAAGVVKFSNVESEPAEIVYGGVGRHSAPTAMAFAPHNNGTLYMATNDRVMRLELGGRLEIVTGTNGGTGNFNGDIRSIAVGSDGTLYATSARQVRMLEMGGNWTTAVDTQASDGAFTSDIRSIAVGPNGTLYATELDGDHVRKLENRLGANWETVVDNDGVSGNFGAVQSIAIDRQGDLYTVTRSEGELNIWMLDNAGQRELDKLRSPQGVALGPDGTLYIADADEKAVLAYAGEGPWQPLTTLEDGTGPFDMLTDVAVANDGTVYVVSEEHSAVYTFTDNIRWQTVNDALGRTGNFISPKGLFLDSDDRIHVSEGGDFEGDFWEFDPILQRWLRSLVRYDVNTSYDFVRTNNGDWYVAYGNRVRFLPFTWWVGEGTGWETLIGGLTGVVGLDITSDGTLYVGTGNGVLSRSPEGIWSDFLMGFEARFLTLSDDESILYVTTHSGLQEIQLEPDGSACLLPTGALCSEDYECASNVCDIRCE